MSQQHERKLYNRLVEAIEKIRCRDRWADTSKIYLKGLIWLDRKKDQTKSK